MQVNEPVEVPLLAGLGQRQRLRGRQLHAQVLSLRVIELVHAHCVLPVVHRQHHVVARVGGTGTGPAVPGKQVDELSRRLKHVDGVFRRDLVRVLEAGNGLEKLSKILRHIAPPCASVPGRVRPT